MQDFAERGNDTGGRNEIFEFSYHISEWSSSARPGPESSGRTRRNTECLYETPKRCWSLLIGVWIRSSDWPRRSDAVEGRWELSSSILTLIYIIFTLSIGVLVYNSVSRLLECDSACTLLQKHYIALNHMNTQPSMSKLKNSTFKIKNLNNTYSRTSAINLSTWGHQRNGKIYFLWKVKPQLCGMQSVKF